MDQQEHYQVIYYIKRKRGTSKAQFYDHWENVHAKKVAPWAERNAAVLSYRQVRSHISLYKLQKELLKSTPQVHTSGLVIPNGSSLELNNDPDSRREFVQPAKFDGIATWEVTSVASFMEEMEDQYYKDVIVADEANLIDTEGFGGGIVARFIGKSVTIVENGKSIVGTVEKDQMRALDTMMNRKDLVDFQEAPDM